MAFLYKRKYPSGKIVWVIFFRVGGKQKSKVIGETDKRTAEKVFTKFCADLASGDFGIKEIRDITLAEFKEQYLITAKNEKAVRTVDREEQVLKPFLEYFSKGKILLRSITSRNLTEYRNERRKKVSPETMNLEFRHLKSIFNLAKRMEYLKDNPLTRIPQLRVPESDLPKFFKLEEIEQIRDAFKGNEFENLVEFYLLTGVRLKEALGLTRDDIDTERHTIVIKSTHTKGKRHRIISYSGDLGLRKLVEQIRIRKDNLIFGPAGDKSQWSEGWVSRTISKKLTDIGLHWATCHTFRHTYISHLVMAGVPLTTVREIVGHSSINTTLKYAHFAPSHTSEMLKKRPY